MTPRTAPPPKRVAPSRSPASEDPADDDDEVRTAHSDFRMDPTSLLKSEHTRDNVHPFVEQDLRDAIKVDLYPWVEAVLGVSRTRLNAWTSQIGEQNWFDDEIIQQHLKDYCDAQEEPERYEPFCGLANRILYLARGNLLGIRKSKSYPVDSVQFINTTKRMVSKIPEHGPLGAERYLDVTMTHGAAAQQFKEGGRIDWVDVLHFIELKFVDKLSVALAAEKKTRASPSQTNPVRSTKSKTTRRAGRRRTTARTAQRVKASHPQDTTQIGSKRPREPDDPLGRMSLGSSCAKPSSPGYSQYQGKEGALQSGTYALEILSCSYGTRLYCHSTLLKDDRLFLWYYDACGIVYTNQYLSLLKDFEKTAAIIVALARCTPERFGIMPASIIKPPIPYSRSMPPRHLTDAVVRLRHAASKEDIQVTLKDSIYAQYVSSGRRTFAYTMRTSPQLSNESLMVKFSYQVNTRTPEYELVGIARKAGVGHLPDVHLCADLWKMSEGARRVFFQDDENQAKYEDRTLRMIVYTEYGTIKTLFSQRCDLIPVMVDQMVKCLHDLRFKANMLHRDISVNNIMFCMRGDKYYFILNDFDMAIVLPEDAKTPYRPSSKHRTGTLPFMAVSLLRDAGLYKSEDEWIPIKHLLCHDYESLFWVSLWCVLTLLLHEVSPQARKKYLSTVKKWETGLASEKESLSIRPLRTTAVTLPPSAKCIEAWFDGWADLLWDACAALRGRERSSTATPFDQDTAGGTLSKDNILKTLTPLMPFQQTGEDEEEESLTHEVVTAEVPAVLAKQQKKAISEEAKAVKAAVLSRLRPRKAA